MKFLRILLRVIAILMIAMGILWIGQGLNIIRWPAESFMIGVPRWSWNGLALVIGGLLALWIMQRSGRSNGV